MPHNGPGHAGHLARQPKFLSSDGKEADDRQILVIAGKLVLIFVAGYLVNILEY